MYRAQVDDLEFRVASVARKVASIDAEREQLERKTLQNSRQVEQLRVQMSSQQVRIIIERLLVSGIGIGIWHWHWHWHWHLALALALALAMALECGVPSVYFSFCCRVDNVLQFQERVKPNGNANRKSAVVSCYLKLQSQTNRQTHECECECQCQSHLQMQLQTPK